MKRVDVGIIGLGKMGILHAALLHQVPMARVTAVCERDQSLWSYGRSLGVKAPFYSDLDLMLQQHPLDAIFVCTPTGTHLPIVRSAWKQSPQLSIFVEKPMAESLASAAQMAALAKGTRVSTGIGYMLPFKPNFLKLKELIDRGSIGTVERVSGYVYVTEVMRQRTGWRYDPTLSGGGAVIEIASHLLAVILWAFGEPSTVSAQTRPDGNWSEDEASITMEYSGGRPVIQIETSRIKAGFPSMSVRLEITGSEGEIKAEDEELFIAGRNSDWHRIDRREFPSSRVFDVGGDAYFLQDSAFISSVADKSEKYAVDWDLGHAVQAVIHAIYQSAKAGSTPTQDWERT
jgi:predicted dehydrogenase